MMVSQPSQRIHHIGVRSGGNGITLFPPSARRLVESSGLASGLVFFRSWLSICLRGCGIANLTRLSSNLTLYGANLHLLLHISEGVG